MKPPAVAFWAFHVAGVPITQGSMVAFPSRDGKRVVVKHDKHDALKAWRLAIGVAARAAGMRELPCPIAIEATFWLPRPSRPTHQYPVGDVDKLGRALLDALSHIAYLDDSQVVSLNVRKGYAETFPTGVDVTVQSLA